MKLALLCPLACLVGLGTAVGGVKKGHDCRDGAVSLDPVEHEIRL